MSNDRLRKRLKNLRAEYEQLSIRIRAQESLVRRFDGKDPVRWAEANRELKKLKEKRLENLRRQEDIRDHLPSGE